MLYEHLKNVFSVAKLSSAWIISSNNVEKSLADVLLFAKDHLSLDYFNPDVQLIKPSGVCIAIDQIRDLNKFISKTASSSYKLAVIYDAAKMNPSSANAFLKILEDYNFNTNVIILLTTQIYKLPITIRSRCHKVFLPCDSTNKTNSNIIRDVSYITQDNWLECANNILGLVGQRIKAICSKENVLEVQRLCLEFDQISYLINKTMELEMDYKQTYLMILDHLS